MYFRNFPSALFKIARFKCLEKGKENPCLKLFESLDNLTGGDHKKRAETIDAGHPDFCCEGRSVSRHSCWGPVHDVEFIFRLVFSPLHIDPVTGEVNAALFQDVADKGLSCNRSLFRKPGRRDRLRGFDHIGRHNEDYPDRPRGFAGIIAAQAKTIRELQYESGGRAFAIYDTGLMTDDTHIDVFAANFSKRSEQKRMRRAIQKVFSTRPELN